MLPSQFWIFHNPCFACLSQRSADSPLSADFWDINRRKKTKRGQASLSIAFKPQKLFLLYIEIRELKIFW